MGLVVNQTSLVYAHQNDGAAANHAPIHLVDHLLANNVDVRTLFAPEHGIRGNKGAGEQIDNGKDSATQLPIQSIYGKHKIPPNEVLQGLDVIIFDIQDVGARFYTYISSMHYMMQAAAAHNITFIVLDRPNPNGEFVDGPVLDIKFQSFVGMHPIPVLHGLTVGELALMIKGENWIENASKLDLHVVSMQAYHKQLKYDLPVAPSPNLPNSVAIRLYPSLCFFEPSAVSIGRGTEFPFQVTGHNKILLGDFKFTPLTKPFAAPTPKLQNELLSGLDLRSSEIKGLDLSLLINYYQAFSKSGDEFFTSSAFFDKLAGTDALRLAIENGQSIENIRASWQPKLDRYKQMREKYLLYPLYRL